MTMLRAFTLFLLMPCIAQSQNCSDFLELIAQRDIYQTLTEFRNNCGPFEEAVSKDGMTKTWSQEKNGIKVIFINQAKDQFTLPQFEVIMVELTAFTDSGGYKQDFPFGFQLGMDYKMVKDHILKLESVDFEKRNLGKTSSSFTYTGSSNTALENRQIKVSIVQFDGKTISSMRFRLK